MPAVVCIVTFADYRLPQLQIVRGDNARHFIGRRLVPEQSIFLRVAPILLVVLFYFLRLQIGRYALDRREDCLDLAIFSYPFLMLSISSELVLTSLIFKLKEVSSKLLTRKSWKNFFSGCKSGLRLNASAMPFLAPDKNENVGWYSAWVSCQRASHRLAIF